MSENKQRGYTLKHRVKAEKDVGLEVEKKIRATTKALQEERNTEYLVRGAELVCNCGSHIRKLNLPLCHAVYFKGHPAVHELDCIYDETGLIGNITAYGACDSGMNMLGSNIETYEFSDAKDKKGELKSNNAHPEKNKGKDVRGKECKPDIIGQWMDAYD